jgi:starch synthase
MSRLTTQEVPMRVLFATVEMSPLVKVGGLADVAGSLPKALVQRGHDVRVVMPLHGVVDTAKYGFQRIVADLPVETPRGPELAGVWQGEIAGVTVYLIECADMFERPQVYGEPDDTQRWLFFCDATLEALPRLGWQPEVLHANDWHAAFLATRLRDGRAHPFAALPVVYTIHNLALKGDFDEGFAHANALRVHPGYDTGVAEQMLYSGMAQGIVHADAINTVSETYAREILTAEFGAGLDGLLRRRQDDLFGIVNGIDYDEFNPATDPRIPSHFSVDNVPARAAVRAALQRFAGLDESASPIVGIVNRLFWQKGADIAVEAVDRLLQEGAGFQFIVLGTGDEQYHRQLQELESRFPSAVKVFLKFDPDLAQLIYAGSDMFLMPSRYEPCGLGQMIAMRYGSVPVVRRTGGLADTVPDADQHPATGRGFVFDAPEGGPLADALRRALAAYADSARWRAIQLRGMRADLSWNEAAGHYVRLYQAAAERAKAPARRAS